MNNQGIDEIMSGKLYFNKYRPEKKIGEGSFGKIYSSTNVNNGQKYALKFEKKEQGVTMLDSEAYYMNYLKGWGIPLVITFGSSGAYNILVMELLGKSLEQIFQERNKHFSLKTTCMIGIQMVERLQLVHEKGLVYRDIKPDNFCIGINNKSHIVFILDFGLSKKYRSTSKVHIKFEQNRKLTGTARYSSINALRGYEQSRRDDLESIGYVMLYFLRGSLPWQGLKVDRRVDRYKKIFEKKKSTSPEELCEGYPNEFIEYINYTRKLEFEEEPDYNLLKGLLKKMITDKNEEFDYMYDWSTTKPDLTIQFEDEEIDGADLKALESIDVDSKRNNRGKVSTNNDSSKQNDENSGVLVTEQAQYNAPVPHNLEDEKKGNEKDKDKNKDIDKSKDKDKDKKDKKKKEPKDPNKKTICIIF